ncbi:hypothetical protein TSH7_09850 [Azospirillum sp. TSH7]|uniref:DUF7173 family protein n=1 Tax=unclassified Azospirillum TaxID=2630922 RepID=UPI000D61DCBA|nr:MULTISPECIES: hypothetical protein [unclassified Azospirillum]PWC63973.1 hypothetical protein TSH20_18945 [Azospirillum sp. TSH20]PWC64836.1 hypothetical protein TSH7_09850 [Azospirillum sp. TSH7]
MTKRDNWTWDTWAKPEATPESDALTETAERLLALKASKEAIETQIDQCEGVLAAAFPEELGTFSHQFGSAVVTVKRGEKWEWDQTALEKKFAGVPVPDFVAVKYGIKKTEFLKLPPEEQAALADALNKKMGSPSVSVSPAHKAVTP